MAGQKRTRNGQIKPQSNLQQPHTLSQPQQTDATPTEASPPCGKPQPHSSKSAEPRSTPDSGSDPKEPSYGSNQPEYSEQPTQQQSSKPTTRNRKNRQKLARLPNNATISKRPLLHPPIPAPFASSHAQKVLYITASTPYIPAVKRVRKLLSEILKREKQSIAAQQSSKRGRARKPPEPNGRLAPADVEREIASGAAAATNKEVGVLGRENVYLKATGRAIQRALELGVHFQGEEDCWVRVEMGSVSAIDDIEVGRVMGEDMGSKEGVHGEVEGEEDIPETRLRTLSSVTVSIGLK
ncbi:Nn.00g036450.m01.CDS01 [Neocucurbitaria sp. VM-36]